MEQICFILFLLLLNNKNRDFNDFLNELNYIRYLVNLKSFLCFHTSVVDFFVFLFLNLVLPVREAVA
jgi:hypothetical protein